MTTNDMYSIYNEYSVYSLNHKPLSFFIKKKKTAFKNWNLNIEFYL